MKKNARKLLALLIACLMVASGAACGESKTQAPASQGDASAPADAPADTSAPAGTESGGESDRVLNIAVEGDPGSLLPLAASGQADFCPSPAPFMMRRGTPRPTARSNSCLSNPSTPSVKSSTHSPPSGSHVFKRQSFHCRRLYLLYGTQPGPSAAQPECRRDRL